MEIISRTKTKQLLLTNLLNYNQLIGVHIPKYRLAMGTQQLELEVAVISAISMRRAAESRGEVGRGADARSRPPHRRVSTSDHLPNPGHYTS